MKKLIMSMVIAMITMFAIPGFTYNPPAAPAEGWYVVDQAGKLSADQMQKLNQKIEQMNKTTKNEYGILLLQDMDGDNIEDVAHATFNAWGVGKKDLDNGILIVVAIKERKSRIETGKGVGGELPDLRANQILKEKLNPHLKNGDFYSGFDATLTAVSSHLESRANQTTAPPPSSGCAVSTADMSAGSVLWFIPIVLFFGYLVYRIQARRKETDKWIKEEQEKLSALRAAQKRDEEERKAKMIEDAAANEAKANIMRRIAEKEATNMAAQTVAKAAARKAQTSLPKAPPRPVTRLKPTTIVTAPAAASVIDNIKKDLDSHKKNELARQRDADLAEARRREERKRKAAEEELEAAALAASMRLQQAEARRREEAEERRREKARQEEDDRRSTVTDTASAISSFASLFDSGSSSSDSGSGFGGGDSGGGGSSSDW